MKLVNILALTHAKLVNEPFVNSFENISFDARKIKRGDLFIAYDLSFIEEAILNGAYGVMFDKPTQISDSEIAWIKVEHLDIALKKLLRFRLIEKEICSYSCSDIVLRLSQQTSTSSEFMPIDGDIKSLFLSLWGVEKGTSILFSPNICDSDIFTDIKQLPIVKTASIKIVDQTLFETSFVYNNTFYERQQISSLFIPSLEQLLNFYKKLNINFRIKKFSQLEHFEAVFVNKNLEIKEFGSTDKVIIFEPSDELIDMEIEFLQTKAKWAKIIYILPPEYKPSNKTIDNITTYKNEDDVLNILKNQTFHFALVVKANKSIFSKPTKIQTQPTLF